jgi:glycosyltransferase involved in cell wall biosynthesis
VEEIHDELMTRVLRIINRLNLGGPTYNVAYLTKYLYPEFETMLVAGMKEDTEESSEFIVRDLGLTPVYIEEMSREINIQDDIKAYKKLKSIIKDFKPDIVHTHAAKAGTLGRLAALNCNVPVILHTFHGHVFHSYFGKLKTELFRQIERYLASRTTGIIAISDIQKQELCDKYRISSPDKCHVVPLGFDLSKFYQTRFADREKFRAGYGISDDAVLVGVIGRIVPVKNHSLFLKAFKRSLINNPDKSVKAVIIGDGEDRDSVIKMAQDLGLIVSVTPSDAADADVIFTSWILNIEVPLAGLDIVALSSDNEGTPVSLIEAQAAGKPVASTEVGGIRDIVLTDESALLSDPGDVIGLSDNISQLINNQELRNEMGKVGETFVTERFSYQRLVGDMRELYRSLLANMGG